MRQIILEIRRQITHRCLNCMMKECNDTSSAIIQIEKKRAFNPPDASEGGGGF